MIDSAYCQLMADYNSWMNRKLYEVCAQIPDVRRKEDRGAFFKSIHGTLNHLLHSDRVWLGRLTQNSFVATGIGQELYTHFDDLQRERVLTDQFLVDWAQTVTSAGLSQPLEYISNVDGQMRTLPTWVLVAHLFNHQTHHRGQVTTLLSQMGYDLGITDLPWLPRFDALVKAERSPQQPNQSR